MHHCRKLRNGNIGERIGQVRILPAFILENFQNFVNFGFAAVKYLGYKLIFHEIFWFHVSHGFNLDFSAVSELEVEVEVQLQVQLRQHLLSRGLINDTDRDKQIVLDPVD